METYDVVENQKGYEFAKGMNQNGFDLNDVFEMFVGNPFEKGTLKKSQAWIWVILLKRVP
jgi:hypothetical protein